MPIETYEVREGQRIDLPSGDAPPGASGQVDAPGAGHTGAPGATDPSPAGTGQPSDSPPETPPAPAGEAGADTEDDEPLRDDTEITAARLERRFARLTRLRRQAERELAQDRQRHTLEMARTRGELEAVQRLLSGAAPALPDTPAPPPGPPRAEQFERHEEFVQAAAYYAADQRIQQERQQERQVAMGQQLLQREQAFTQAHPDFHTVVRTGLAGNVSPVLQQALMLIPDGPAVAYALATQPELVQRLNTLPPPLVLVELGRLSQAPTQQPSPPPALGQTHGLAPAAPVPPMHGTAPPALPAPLTPLSGAGAGAPTGSFREDMTQAEYRQWRTRTSQLPAWKER